MRFVTYVGMSEEDYLAYVGQYILLLHIAHSLHCTKRCNE